ncbi:hypothetical protein, partial [Anaerotruncus colihominis]|uniref:hypothetical protein n=1 Tax=Anaerotruncus colihominis TaxID=169435 RepID=UPI00210CE01B
DQIRRGEIPKGYIRTVSGISPTDWKRYTFGDIYTERKEPGSEELPLLMVSIHSGVSDGEVDEEDLPKKVKRIAPCHARIILKTRSPDMAFLY